MAVVDHTPSAESNALHDLLEVAARLGDRLRCDDVSRWTARTTLIRWAAGDALLLQRAARTEYRNGNETMSDLLAECAAMLHSGSISSDATVELDLDSWLGR